jgi:hypothetical protein
LLSKGTCWEKAVLGAICLTASTKFIDVTGDEPVDGFFLLQLIPGSYTKFAAGDFQVPCA